MTNHKITNKKQIPKQSNQYDKILRENLEVTLPVIIKEVLGLDIVESEELPDDVQHTKERKPDALKKVTDAQGKEYVLHVEFQVRNDSDMVYRMAEYCVMLMRRYRLPVRQYVIYLGDKKMSMISTIEEGSITFSYHLIDIAQADYQLFLKSDNPEVKMLGILANFESGDSYSVVKEIIEGMQANTEGDFATSRYFKQLRIFVQLRSEVGHQFERIMETITKFFKEEKDYLFRKGEAKGIEKGIEKGAEAKSYEVVENLITELSLTDDAIVRIAEVSLDFVKNVRKDLAKNKK